MAESRPKIEATLSSDAEIESFVAAFENCTLPYSNWTHRAHLAVALVYLTSYPLDVALDRARHHINLYNRTCGDPDGYHETITMLFLRRVEQFLAERAEPLSLVEALDELVQFSDMRWPLRHYSPERLWSAEAKAAWVDPDREPLGS